MFNIKVLVYVAVFALLVNFANAATVHGTVYDFSLKKAVNARVEIYTTPKQLIVAQDGTYSFDVPNGKYTIKAVLMQKNMVTWSAQENITIKQDGSYVLDLVLLPEVEEGIEEPALELDDNIFPVMEKRSWIVFFAISIAAIALVIFAIVHYKNARKGEEKSPEKAETMHEKDEISEEDELIRIIEILQQQGGRATQKDIRKSIPLSEAKISLMIAELEHKGKIEKIKKGRGNIIILRKDL